MKRLTIFISLILLPIFGITQSYRRTSSVKEQQDDFIIFKTTLLECHVGIFDYNDSLSLNLGLAQLENRISDRPLMLIEQFALYTKFISTINCIHTNTLHKKLNPKSLKANFKLPFGVYFSNSQLHSTENYTSSQFEVDKGDQILAINNELIDNLKDSLYQFISSDGNNTSRKDEVLKHHFLYYYFLYRQLETDLTLIYTHNGDTLIKKCLLNKDTPKKRIKKKNAINYLIDTLAAHAILTLPSPLPQNKKYKQNIHDFIAKINNLGVQNLVLDIRDNGGGKSQKYLAGFFIDSCIEYSRNYYTSIHNNSNKKYFIHKMKLQYLFSNFLGRIASQKEKIKYIDPQLQYDGQLFVLINGNTASAASNLASILKEWANAIIVGKESGGGYRSINTGGGVLQLPYSKIRIRIRSIKSYNNVQNHYYSDGVTPNYPIEEYNPFNSKGDRQLDYIINELILIRTKLH